MNQTIVYQRIEGILIFLTCLYLYLHLGFYWGWFVLLLLSVDIFMLGYLINPVAGAHIYNIGHSYILSTVLLIIGVSMNSGILIAGAIIWIAHIGWDRAFGYGLKFRTGFKDTHLGSIGKNKKSFNN